MSKSDSELLEEMARWLKIMGIQEIRPVIDDVFDFDDEQRTRNAKIAYELTDGENSQREIEDHIDYSYNWVSDRQQEWAEHGLVEKASPNSPYEHVVSLTELGIDVPGLDEILREMVGED